LVLADVQTGQAQQAARVVASVHDLGLDRDGRAVDVRGEGQLADVEPEVIEAADAGLDPPALAGPELFGAGQLSPQAAVAGRDDVADLDGFEGGVEVAAGGEVHELAGDVGAGEVEVVLTLAGAQRLVQLA